MEKLLEQFSFLRLENYQYLIGEYLIDSIQQNGQLDPDLDYQDIKQMVSNDFKVTISTFVHD